MRFPAWVIACAPFVTSYASGQQEPAKCRVLCEPEFKVEPTVTFTKEATEFEIILALDLATRISWLGITVEAIFLPFDGESTPELEFEANFTWLPATRTGGWLSSHFDVVDKFSEAERPEDRSAYTHKLNLEWDTSFAVFNGLPEGRWLRGIELEGSLDYVATGLPETGPGPWSFSIVLVIPVAPL
ncbi:MAG: hypothetical protein ACRD3V_29495 [Vicinamibacteria bacterium]